MICLEMLTLPVKLESYLCTEDSGAWQFMNPLEVHGSHQCCDSVGNDGKVFKPIKFCSSYS